MATRKAKLFWDGEELETVDIEIDDGLTGLDPIVALTDDVISDVVRSMLGDDILREIPIAEFMVDEDHVPLFAEQLEEARARGAGIREQCKIIGVPWAYRIVPSAACQEYVVTAAEMLPRSTFCQTFPRDAATEAQRSWGMLVSRSDRNAPWMAYNALALIEAAGGFQNAIDVTDYVADAHEFPKTKKVHVVVKESRDWHAGLLNRARSGGGRTLSGNMSIGLDFAGGPDMSAVILRGGGGGGRSLHPGPDQHVVIGDGRLSGRSLHDFRQFYEQQWSREPMIAMGTGVADRLPVDRVVHNANGAEFSINGVRVIVDPNIPLDEITIINHAGDNLRNHLGEAVERMMREMIESLCVPARLLGNTDPIVYPFAAGLPVRQGHAELVLLTTWEEFQRESQLMDHCVGRGTHGPRYWRRASDFEIMIGSVRREGIEAPLATIEFSPDQRPTQIRGQHNHQPPPHDMEIVRSLIKEFQTRIPPLRQVKVLKDRSETGLRCYGGPIDGELFAAPAAQEVLEIPEMERIEYVGDWNRSYRPEMRPAVRINRYRRARFYNGRVEVWLYEGMSLEEAEHRVERDYIRRGAGWFGGR